MDKISLPQLDRNRRVAEMVVSAIQNLKDGSGSTLKSIEKFIESEFHIPSEKVRRNLPSAIKRGMQFGIIDQNRGRYKLSDFIDRIKSCRRRRRRSRRRSKSRRRRRRARRRSTPDEE